MEEVSTGLSNILRDMTQLLAVEEQGYCEHLWELSDQNELLLHYLNVKVIRNFRDADSSYLYGLYHIHSQLHSSLYAHKTYTQSSQSPQLPEVHTTLSIDLSPLFTDSNHCTVYSCHHTHAQLELTGAQYNSVSTAGSLC